METYFIIYKTTCVVTNKFYIGMHKTNNLQDGYLGSGKIFKRSLKKYGKDNHIFEIIEYLPNLDSLVIREREIVNETLLLDELCMNLKVGGYGGFINAEHQKKFSTAGGKSSCKENYQNVIKHHNKLKTDIEYREKFVEKQRDTHIGDKNVFFGKHHTKESIEKIKKALPNSSGINNSQYGTCWITKDSSNKKIKKENLQIWLDEGWKRVCLLSKR